MRQCICSAFYLTGSCSVRLTNLYLCLYLYLYFLCVCICTLYSITRQCVAVHFAGSCSLQLTDGKNSTLFCPISYRNISDILQQNVTSTQPLCVGDEHKYIPLVWCICPKMGSTGILQCPWITESINVLSLSFFVLQPNFSFFFSAIVCFLVQSRSLPKTEASSSARNKELVKRRWLLTFSLYFCACRKSITTSCL